MIACGPIRLYCSFMTLFKKLLSVVWQWNGMASFVWMIDAPTLSFVSYLVIIVIEDQTWVMPRIINHQSSINSDDSTPCTLSSYGVAFCFLGISIDIPEGFILFSDVNYWIWMFLINGFDIYQEYMYTYLKLFKNSCFFASKSQFRFLLT